MSAPAPDGTRVGDVEVMHGSATVLLVVYGKWPGSTQLTPDDADALADRLKEQAAYTRRVNAEP